MKIIKFFLMAMVLTFSLTFTSFADGHVPQQNSKSVKIAKAKKATVVAPEKTASIGGLLVSDFTKNNSVAANTNFSTEAKINTNLPSETRNIYLINFNTESPPDINFVALIDPDKPNEKQIPGFARTDYIRHQLQTKTRVI